MSIDYPFDVETVFSRRKSLAIIVRDQKVQVRAPHFTSKRLINNFLNAKSSWISSKLAQQKSNQSQVPVLEHGTELTLIGQPVTVELKLLTTNRCALQGDKLKIQYKQAENIIPTFERFLLRYAKQQLVQRITEIAQKINIEEHAKKSISGYSFRKTKTKWGHCTADGRIQLNYLLLLAPTEVLDYVIIHELCHLKELNHSAKFWSLVESLCPERHEHQAWLQNNGYKLSYRLS